MNKDKKDSSRRGHERYILNLEARFFVKNKSMRYYDCKILNISPSGLALDLLAPQEIDIGDEVFIEIYNTLKLEQSITSQHLRILRLAGLVETEREGKFIYYRVNYGKISGSVKSIRQFLDETAE